MKKVINEAILKAVLEANPNKDLEAVLFGKNLLDRPGDLSHGDYSTNVAMLLAPKLGVKPIDLAKDLVQKLEGVIEGVSKIEVAGPGFINFYLSQGKSLDLIKEILDEKTGELNYGKSDLNKGKKIVYEYTDPNPFKQFHIGHLMSNAIGESLARITEWSGAEVKRYCYQGDVGRHVALTFYGFDLLKADGESVWPNESLPLSEKVAFLGMIYAKGATYFKDHPEDEEKVQEINKKIYDKSDESLNALYDLGRKWSLEHFEELYKVLGTKFDEYFLESDSSVIGLEEVKKALKAGVFEESEGAVIFKGENYGLNTRVFINKFGLPTYEAKELGLALLKNKKEDSDTSYTITANEQDNVLAVSYKAIEQIYPEIAKKNFHISHGMLRLTTGKMGSRTGNVITGESLLHDMTDMALEKMKEREIPEGEGKEIAQQIAVAAIKYTVLRQTIGKDIIFDSQKALSFEGDSGPYLQYSCVRAKSVLDKADKQGIIFDTNTLAAEKLEKLGVCQLGWAGGKLEKMLIRLPEVLLRAETEHAPHYVGQYLLDVASDFNSFYGNTQIVVDGDELTPYKLALTKATLTVLTNGLNVLGIKVPSRM
ncbi:MAG: arginine--tRNA ligase [bacterium]